MSAKFITRLRVVDNNIVDLAGNTWEKNNVTIAQGIVGESSMHFNNSAMSSSLESVGTDDFTISFWINCEGVSSTSYWSPIFHFPNSEGFLKMIAPLSSNTGIWFIDDTDHIINTSVSGRHHIALCRQGNTFYLFIDGVTTYTRTLDQGYILSTESVSLGMRVGRNDCYYIGTLDDFCIIKGKALWVSDFTPPTNYLSISNTIYLTGQEAWGINGSGDFAKLSNNYSAMTPTEKIAMFNTTNGNTPTISQLKTLTMPIKVVNYSGENTQPTCTVTAIPTPQTITQKDRISLIKYNKITSVAMADTTSGNGIIKLAVTKDNTTYQVYDTTNLSWKSINIANISTDGMSVSEVESLTSTEWALLDCMNTGLGFAYYLGMQDTTDSADIADISINAEVKGPLKSLVKGTDYDYEYVGTDVLQVKLYKNGDFRINYNPG